MFLFLKKNILWEKSTENFDHLPVKENLNLPAQWQEPVFKAF